MGWMSPRTMTITMRREVGIGLSLMGILYVLSIFDFFKHWRSIYLFAPRALVKSTALELFVISTCPVRFTKWRPPAFLPSCFLGQFKCDSIELTLDCSISRTAAVDIGLIQRIFKSSLWFLDIIRAVQHLSVPFLLFPG